MVPMGQHRRELLNLAEGACAKLRISEARLGTLLVNDGKFLRRVRAGGGFTIATYERCLDWFRDKCPELLNGAADHAAADTAGKDSSRGREQVRRAGTRSGARK